MIRQWERAFSEINDYSSCSAPGRVGFKGISKILDWFYLLFLFLIILQHLKSTYSSTNRYFFLRGKLLNAYTITRLFIHSNCPETRQTWSNVDGKQVFCITHNPRIRVNLKITISRLIHLKWLVHNLQTYKRNEWTITCFLFSA